MCFPSTLIKLVVKKLYDYFSGKPELIYHWQKFVSLLLFFTHKMAHTVFENTDICEEERKKNHTSATVTQWQLIL